MTTTPHAEDAELQVQGPPQPTAAIAHTDGGVVVKMVIDAVDVPIGVSGNPSKKRAVICAVFSTPDQKRTSLSTPTNLAALPPASLEKPPPMRTVVAVAGSNSGAR